METLLLWVLVLGFLAVFAAQVATRVRLVASAPDTFATDNLPFRIGRFVTDVLAQRKTIVERPWAGVAHAFVFWGFVAFAGYTALEFLAGLGIVDLTQTGAFHAYRTILTPFAVAVLGGALQVGRTTPRAAGSGRRRCGPTTCSPTSTGPALATDRPRPSTDDSSTSEAPHSGSATSPITSPGPCSRPADSDHDYTLDWDEPVSADCPRQGRAGFQ